MSLCKRHHKHALRCLFHLLLALCAVRNPFVSVEGTNCSHADHQFEARVEYQWTKESDAAFPIEVETSPGFKMLTCVTHSENFSLWGSGEPCNLEMRSFFYDIVNRASSTEINPFDHIYYLYGNNTMSIADHAPRRDGENNGDGLVFSNTIDPQGFDNFTLNATRDKPFMSCFAMIWPSSDWFIGISKVNVCGMEKNPIKFRLNAFDAGLYRTSEYKEAIKSDREAPPEPFIRQVRVVGRSGYGTLSITDKKVQVLNSNGNSESGVCFPADELVTLASGDKRRMDQLSIGDSVMTPPLRYPSWSNFTSDAVPKSRSNTSSRVYAFSHRHPKVMTTFLRISYVMKNINDTTMTSASSSRYPSSMSSRHGHVRLSPSHYIYRFQQTSHLSAHSTPDLTPASDVRVGDLLLISPSSDSASTSLSTVVDIRPVVARGLYNPHSLAGYMVVGDVAVSCYTQTVSPNVAVAALAPVRSAHQVGLWTVADMAVSFVSSAVRRRLAVHEHLHSWLGII